MQGELSHLALMAAVGAALLTLGALAAVGGRRTARLVRDLGLGGLLLALFAGVVAEELSLALAEAAPYTSVFLSSNDLRAQALMEDADLRSRTNVDSRLRYIPTSGIEQVPNLESGYRLEGGLRTIVIPMLNHAAPVSFPRGVEPLIQEGDPEELRREVAGLYESARAAVRDHTPDEGRLDLDRTASVGLFVLGLVGLIAGLLPLIFRLLTLSRDALRLAWAIRHQSYRRTRGRALRVGVQALAGWHFGAAKPYRSLAIFGVLTMLGGVVMGLLREEETRRVAHAVFAEARYLRIGRSGSKP